MLTVLLIVGVLVAVAGFFICLIALNESNFSIGMIGALMLVGGVGSAIFSGRSLSNIIADRERRTAVVTDVVIEAHQTWTKENGCVQSFALNRVPYTFEAECNDFVEFSFSPPKVGDMMKVKFVRPKEPEGKPEVLEVYNLTQAIERARLASPPSPEAPPAN